MVRLLCTAALLGSGCGGATEEIDLVFAGSCDSAELEDVSVLSVEILGRARGAPCALARRCVFDVELTRIDDITAALEAANQPLVDVSDPDAHTLRVIGHDQSCFAADDHLACGSQDLLQIDDDGTLEVVMACGDCPVEEIPFCP
jgi:hypothetical protein